MNRARGWEVAATVAVAGVVLWAAAGPLPARAADNAACTACHDQGAKLEKSAHAALACTTCHVRHEDYPHPANVPKPACSQCHQGQAAD